MKSCGALLLVLGVMQPASASTDLALEIDAGQIIPAEVAGQAVMLAVQADGFGAPVLNELTAVRLAIKAGLFAARARVGPIVVKGSTAVVRYSAAGPEQKRRILWFSKPIAASADGALGPGAIAQGVVTFRLRPTIASEMLTILPLNDKGSFGSLGATVIDKGAPILIQFDLDRDVAMASAPTGVRLSSRHNGVLAKAVERGIVKLGVERPLRRMTLADPLIVGPLRITTIMVRSGDYGDATGIRPEDADPEEIFVMAPLKGKDELLRIGRNDLIRCSTLTFDKAKREVRLSCLP